jgi:hypothetical protein
MRKPRNRSGSRSRVIKALETNSAELVAWVGFCRFCASYFIFSPAVARWIGGMLLVSDPQGGGTGRVQKPDGPSVDSSNIGLYTSHLNSSSAGHVPSAVLLITLLIRRDSIFSVASRNSASTPYRSTQSTRTRRNYTLRSVRLL